MRAPVYFAMAAAVVAAGVATFQVKYDARDARKALAALRAEINADREAIRVLRAEIAWAARPERLAALVRAHPELGLVPVEARRLIRLADLPDAPPETFWARADVAHFLPQEAAP